MRAKISTRSAHKTPESDLPKRSARSSAGAQSGKRDKRMRRVELKVEQSALESSGMDSAGLSEATQRLLERYGENNTALIHLVSAVRLHMDAGLSKAHESIRSAVERQEEQASELQGRLEVLELEAQIRELERQALEVKAENESLKRQVSVGCE